MLDERFDGMVLADQAALVANATIINEHRRHVAEAILARCAKWAASVKCYWQAAGVVAQGATGTLTSSNTIG